MRQFALDKVPKSQQQQRGSLLGFALWQPDQGVDGREQFQSRLSRSSTVASNNQVVAAWCVADEKDLHRSWRKVILFRLTISSVPHSDPHWTVTVLLSAVAVKKGLTEWDTDQHNSTRILHEASRRCTYQDPVDRGTRRNSSSTATVSDSSQKPCLAQSC